MNQTKIIFFDIDGTLIDMQTKKISEKTLEALRRLQARGIRICIATGRSPVSLPKFEGITFDAYLTFNGSLCYDGTKTIFSNPIPAKDVQKLLENAANMQRCVSIATKNRLAANGTDADLAEYFSFAHIDLQVSPDFDKVLKQNIYQIMLSCREEEYSTILNGVADAKIAAWWDRAVDIIPASGGKGRGIQEILNYYGLDSSQALAFGDGNNDIEMFQAVGTGVAMANASERLKNIADDQCGHVADDGIYHYCIEHQLI